MYAEHIPSAPIAIVGMGCRFPGVGSVDELWDKLLANADTVTPVPPERFDMSNRYDPVAMTPGRTVSRHGGFLHDPFGFDAAFFGVSPAEAREMDPQQRLLLHVVWEALESAGIRPSRLAGSRGGVFVGQATAEHAETGPRLHEPDVRSMVGGRLRAVTAGRVSYALDLRGPSVVLDTACSSSLVAVHAARQSLLTGESDLCLAAGVNVILSPHDSIAYSQGGMLSPGGRCRFGDARADGFVRSEGVGVVVLKRLDDALHDGDPVCAVLLGSATANDGAASGLLIRPSTEGQADTVRQACAAAGVKPAELDYVEAHGTGTHVGDGVELRALAESAGAGRPVDRPLLTGSVKTNFGHTEAAAGIAGLIKAALVVRHGVVPASLHLDEPHPLLTQPDFPVRVVTRNQPLKPAGPGLLAGVTSLGLSGTNAHVVVGTHLPERRPATRRAPSPAKAAEGGEGGAAGGPHLLVLSARTPGSLRRLARAYAAYLEPSGAGRGHPLADICSAAATGRDPHPHRLWVVGDDHDALARRLRALADGETVADGGCAEAGLSGDRRVVFVFSGQGSQWAGMGRALYRTSLAFRETLDACDRAVRAELGWSVVERLTSGDHALPADVDVVQPLLWSVQVALAAAWRERGVEPDVCLGHSMGEVAAAHVCGHLSLEDAAAVICRRSRLMQRTAGRGAMLAVELSSSDVLRYIGSHGDAVCVAAENAPTTTVLAGDPTALAALRAELESRDVLCRPVKVNVASHSPQMDALREDLLGELAGLAAPSGPNDTSGAAHPSHGTRPAHPVHMLSTVTGHRVTAREMGPAYWMDNLRRPVQFASTVRSAAREAESVFLEVSPHPVLVAALDETLADAGDTAAVASLHRDTDDAVALARAAGWLFAHGGRVDWRQWHTDGPHHVPSLPTYSWDLVRFQREGEDPSAASGPGPVRVREIDLVPWGGTGDWGGGVSVDGFAPVPPAVYLAAVLETARETEPGAAAWELRDVRLGDTPVPLPAAAGTSLRITLGGPGEGDGRPRAVSVHALLPGASGPVLCATGRAVEAEDGGAAESSEGARAAAPPATLDAALARCHHYVGAGEFALFARRLGYDVPKPFHAVEHLWCRDGEAVARVRLPAALLQHPGAPSPAGWEAGLLPLLTARPGALSPGAHPAYAAVSFDSVRFHGGLEPEFWSVSTVRSESGGAALVADVELLAVDRRPLATFSGIRMQRTASPGPDTAPVPALVSKLTEQYLAPLVGQYLGPLAGLARKAAEPLGVGFLTTLLSPAASPSPVREAPARPEQTDPLARTPAAPAPSSSDVPTAGLPAAPDAPVATAVPAPQTADPADALLGQCAAVLGMPVADIDQRRSLRELGLDSLMATQLRQRLRRAHGIEITAGRLLGAESVAGLGASLVRESP